MEKRTLVLSNLRRQTFRVTLSQFGAALVLLTGIGVALVAYINGRATVQSLSVRIFEAHADFVEAQAADYAQSASASLTRNHRLVHRGETGTTLAALAPHLLDTLVANPRLSLASWGLTDGSTTWVERNERGLLLHVYEGHAQGTPVHRTYIWQDDVFVLQQEEPTTYDGTKRPWYAAGLAAVDAGVWTEPYLFVPDNVPGLTLARRVDRDGELLGVLTVDFRLDFLSQSLAGLDDSDRTVGVLFDEAGYVLAHSDVTRTAVERDGMLAVATLKDHPDPLLQQLDGLGGSDESRFVEVDGRRFALNVHRPQVGALTWRTAIFTPEDRLLSDVRRHALWSVVIAAMGVVMAMLASIWISRRLTESFYGFYEEMEAVGRLELGVRQRAPTRILEVERLGLRLDDLKKGLRSFSRYLPVDLVRQLLREGREARLGGETRELTVLFTDIANFTTIVESHPAEELVDALGAYLATLDEVIHETGGNVTGYLGDGILALWGAPAMYEDHALRACRAALRMHARTQSLAELAKDNGVPAFFTRIGVNSGEVIVGNIGSPERFNYTAIGDVVNTASRIEGLNKVYDTGVLIGERTRELLGDALVTRRVDRVRMKGKTMPVWVYELVGEASRVSEETLDALRRYEGALDAYGARDFEQALAGFVSAAQGLGGDWACERFAESCRDLVEHPPGADWDGVRVMRQK